MKKLQAHPAAAIFPLIEGDAFTELKESIQQNGQREPIVLFGGKILDGQNRYRACLELKINPVTREFDPAKDGPSVLRFILDKNLRRRHLTISQRALITAEAMKAMQTEATMMADEAKKRADKEAKAAKAAAKKPQQNAEYNAEPELPGSETEAPEPAPEPAPKPAPKLKEMAAAAGISTGILKEAKSLVEEAPEIAADVKAGKKTVAQAKMEAAEAKAHADQKAHQKEILARITKVCGAEFARAFDENTILKTAKEAAEFLKLDDKTMKGISGLLVSGWKVARAVTFFTKKITTKTKVGDLMNMAIANKGVYVIEINGFEVAVTKLDASK